MYRNGRRNIVVECEGQVYWERVGKRMKDEPLSLWPRRRSLNLFFCFFHAARSCLILSSISSLTRFASASLRSLAARSSAVSPGGGASTFESGSSPRGSVDGRMVYMTAR